MSRLVTDHLPLLAGAPNGVKKLRELILELAVRGKLVPQIGSGFPYVLLSDVIHGMDSGWSPACLDNSSPSEVVWGVLKTTAVQPMAYLQDENKELPSHLNPRPEAEVKIGDILFTRAGPTNRVGISCLVEETRPRLMISDKIIRFHPLEEKISGRFLALCLHAGEAAKYLEQAKSGMAASQVNISQAKLKSTPIPLPPLSEQNAIVTKVDELMALCDRLETRQSDAQAAHARLVDELLGSLLQARDAEDFSECWGRVKDKFDVLFTTEKSVELLKRAALRLGMTGGFSARNSVDTWRKIKVADVGHIKLGRQRSPKDHFGPNMVPYLRVANVLEAKIDTTDVKSMNFTPEEQITFRLLPGDILLNEGQSKELVGRPAIFNNEVPDACFQNTLLRFRCYDCVTPSYTLKYFLHCMYSGIFQKHAQQTTNIAHLSSGRLATIDFLLPPLEEQHRIVAKVDEFVELCDRVKAKMARAQALNERLAGTLVERAVSLNPII